MALRFNGAEIPTSGDVRFLGASFNEVRYNGITFWSKGIGTTPPPQPGFCDASDGSYQDMVRVQYGYSHYDVNYNIFRSEDDISYSQIATVMNGDLWYDDSSVLNNITYYYKTTACWKNDDTICSGFSETDTGYSEPDDTTQPPQNAPLNLVASDATYYNKIVLGWENGTEADATNVNIYRDDSLIDSVIFSVTEYQDFGVELGTVYTYHIAFKNGSGEGPISNTDEGSTLDDNIYVLKSGDTMTGNLTINNIKPYLNLKESDENNYSAISCVDGSFRVETRSQAGSWLSTNFMIQNDSSVPQLYGRTIGWYIDGNKIWTSGNDGSGSGLDADTVDGYHGNAFPKGSWSFSGGVLDITIT